MKVNASRIRAAREHRGISQEKMAESLRISQSTYARMESGQQKIEAGQLFLIAEQLEEPAASFLDDSFFSMQYGNPSFTDNAALNQYYYSVQKELIDEYLKLFKEELSEMRKEREKLFELLISKID